MFLMKVLNKFLENRIDQPPDVYSAISPLFNICNIFGLAPYSLKHEDNGKKTFYFTIWPILRSVCLVAIFIAILSYYYVCNFELLDAHKDDLQFKVRFFQELLASLLSSINILFGCLYTKKMIEIFRNIDEIDGEFKSLGVWVPYKKIHIKIILHIILLLLYCVLILTVICILTLPRNGDYFAIAQSFCMILILKVVPTFVNILMELQYINYLTILRRRYKLLNQYLEALIQTSKSYNGWMDQPISIINKSQKLKLKVTPNQQPKSLIAISDPVFVVDQVVALHIKLTDTAHLINLVFCIQQLLRITLTFVSAVTALFLIAMNFSSNDDSVDGPGIMFTLWALTNTLEVICIVWVTSETTEEANTCPRILHKIRNNTTNTKLQDTIEIYSLQMYHNKLYFTVCGLFPLDYTLLYTIVAGVTTYLVILIQFNIEFVKKQGEP